MKYTFSGSAKRTFKGEPVELTSDGVPFVLVEPPPPIHVRWWRWISHDDLGDSALTVVMRTMVGMLALAVGVAALTLVWNLFARFGLFGVILTAGLAVALIAAMTIGRLLVKL